MMTLRQEKERIDHLLAAAIDAETAADPTRLTNLALMYYFGGKAEDAFKPVAGQDRIDLMNAGKNQQQDEDEFGDDESSADEA